MQWKYFTLQERRSLWTWDVIERRLQNIAFEHAPNEPWYAQYYNDKKE